MTTNYREILRLDSLGLNKTDIASAAQCARNTVSTTLARAKVCGLQWPLPEGISDKELEEKLFPSAPGKVVYKMPDYAHVHREMQRQGVTLLPMPRRLSAMSMLSIVKRDAQIEPTLHAAIKTVNTTVKSDEMNL